MADRGEWSRQHPSSGPRDLVFVEDEKASAAGLRSSAGAVIAGEFAAPPISGAIIIMRPAKLASARAAQLLLTKCLTMLADRGNPADRGSACDSHDWSGSSDCESGCHWRRADRREYPDRGRLRHREEVKIGRGARSIPMSRFIPEPRLAIE